MRTCEATEAGFMRPKNTTKDVSELSVRRLVECATVLVTDTVCRGTCRHKSAEESSATTQLVFPYRGVYVRHVGTKQTVADGNQILFFNAAEGYRVSHPIPGGDRNLSLIVNESQLRELAPNAL